MAERFLYNIVGRLRGSITFLTTLILILLTVSNSSQAHTNSVGFILKSSSLASCVAGAQPDPSSNNTCFDVEVFYGTWHNNIAQAEGDLAIFIQNPDGSETQVIGQSSALRIAVPFTMQDSLEATIPDNPGPDSYSIKGAAPYANLANAFTLGLNYFFHDNVTKTLSSEPSGGPANFADVWAHQSAVAAGLGAGRYRIAYDAATSGNLSFNWMPTDAIQQLVFTISKDGRLDVIDKPSEQLIADSEILRKIISDDEERILRGSIQNAQSILADAASRLKLHRHDKLSCDPSDDSSISDEERSDLDEKCLSEAGATEAQGINADGSLSASDRSLDASGRLTIQNDSNTNLIPTLITSNFNVQKNGWTNSNTDILRINAIWERMTEHNSIVGNFLSIGSSKSKIHESFNGNHARNSLAIGSFFVKALDEKVYWDGFFSVGLGKSNLNLSDPVMLLNGDYEARTLAFGTSVSGVYQFEDYNIKPDISFTYGLSHIGSVDFRGVAHGTTEDNLVLQINDVSVSNLTLRPTISKTLNEASDIQSESEINFAPRLICEQIISVSRKEFCGAGVELGFRHNSKDKKKYLDIKIIADQVGQSVRKSQNISLVFKF